MAINTIKINIKSMGAEMNRREFLKITSFMLAGAAAGFNGADIMAKEHKYSMPLRVLGKDFKVSALGLGCMGMSANHGPARDKKEMINLIAEAYDLGINFFDTAEIYGPHINEELVGSALKRYRKQVAIGTKFGLYYPNGKQLEDARPESIRKALEGSLKRLQTDYVDIYYQHRIDNKVPIEDVAGTMKDLVKEGKILHWGMSEPNIETIKRAHKEFPVTAVENQYAMSFRRHEEQTFKVIEELGIGLVAYSPLDRGYLAGQMDGNTKFDKKLDMRAGFPRMSHENMTKNRVIIDFLKELGNEKGGATPAQIALAWILAQKPWIVPIPETTNISHLRENIKAVNITWTKKEMEEINKRLSKIKLYGERFQPESDAATSVYNLI